MQPRRWAAAIAMLAVITALVAMVPAHARVGGSADLTTAKTPVSVNWSSESACATAANGYCTSDPALTSDADAISTAVVAADPATGVAEIVASPLLGLDDWGEVVDYQWANGAWSNLTSRVASVGENWTDVQNSTSSHVQSNCMAFDPTLGGFVLIADEAGYGYGNYSTLLLKGNAWSFVLPAGTTSSPPVSAGCAAAWDPASNALVAVFDVSGTNAALQTWELTGTTWSMDKAGSVVPHFYEPIFGGSYYAHPELAWDATDSELVTYGPAYGGSHSTATYTFAGATWTNRSTLSSQPGNNVGEVFAPWSGGVVAYGGGYESTSTVVYDLSYFVDNVWIGLTDSGVMPYTPSGGFDDLGGAVGSGALFVFAGSATYGGTAPGSLPVASLICAGSSCTTGTGGPGPATVTAGSSCQAAKVSWSNPAPPYSFSIVNDTVYVYRSYGGPLVEAVSTNGPAGTATITGLACGEVYDFQVQAWYSNGAASPLSGPASIAAGAFPTSSTVLTSSPLAAYAVIGAAALGVVALLVVLLRPKRPGGAARHLSAKPSRMGR